MKTTLKQIRAAGPCGLHLDEDGERTGYLKLKHYLGRGYGDDTPISIATVLNSNGLDDALWCFAAVEGHGREKRLYGVWCVRRVESLMEDEQSTNALRVSERYANGLATDAELVAARDAAWGAAEAASAASAAGAASAVWAAAWAASAAWAAWDIARASAWDATTWDASATARASAWDATSEATRASAWDTARAAQADELRRVCACIDAGEDPYPFTGVQSSDKVEA